MKNTPIPTSSNEPFRHLTTGLPGLDGVLHGVMPGDNIVWKVESIEDYRALVMPYAMAARQAGARLIYFRFASHPQLLDEGFGAEIHRFDPVEGFERFTGAVHAVIEEAGRGAIYIFDCLSELASAWCSDQMLGNFFVLTCPRLLVLETVTYFALYRNAHASFALRPITETTQFLLDVFRYRQRIYIRPIKVQHRSSSSMNTIHVWEPGDRFPPVTASAIVAELLVSSKWPGLCSDHRVGFWRQTFDEARAIMDAVRGGRAGPEEERALFAKLSRMVISRDEEMLKLAERYLTMDDIFDIRYRMIGIGLIGGKAVGMLLARAILRAHDPRFEELLETHDSFFIGSEVFYTFLVRNGVWWIRHRQRDPETFLEGIDEAREKVLKGQFPDYTIEQFKELIDYFGQAPFIVRSSSLLEDNYGNAFAGKYDSVFCVNQGSREKRLEDFLNAVRHIYASSLSEPALRYRARRGILDRDEQMALLVMRVSGQLYGRQFYPQVAGVGFSYNPYCWNEYIDPKAGVVRLVFGLGTRAVDRADDDYTRVVALNAPDRRPEANFDEVCQYAQRRVDYLDLERNTLTSGWFADLIEGNTDLPLDMFATADYGEEGRGGRAHWCLTFDRLLHRTPIVQDLRDMLGVLEKAYRYPVDIEFALNVIEGSTYKINLLQCRPLQVYGSAGTQLPTVHPRPEERILETRGAVIGQSRLTPIDRLIYVVPERYGAMPLTERYEVARVIGRINAQSKDLQVMLLGPGRWGTTSPELGIPVHFSDICHVSVLCEIVAMRENLIPDASLGTHFLNELVEMNILYLALYPKRDTDRLDETFFLGQPNRLAERWPEDAGWSESIRVIDPPLTAAPPHIALRADVLAQTALCYRTEDPPPRRESV